MVAVALVANLLEIEHGNYCQNYGFAAVDDFDFGALDQSVVSQQNC